jgi:hypothetical protein
MIQHLRSRLRAVIATAICALVAAPALVTGTMSIAAAAPPGSLTGLVTVGGESNALGNSNPWRFGDEAAAYSGLRADLVNPQLFGSSGTFSKGRFQIAPGLDEITPSTLANLDIFVGGIQRGGDSDGTYTASEVAALQAFNANGGALVLNNNSFGFGDLSDWLGFGLRPQRAFYGNNADCGTAATDEHAPVAATPVGGAHPVIIGPFGNSGNLFMYHTATVFTSLPGTAQARYSINVTGQAPTFALTGPFGELPGGARVDAYLQAPFTITTAVTTPFTQPGNVETITSVDFYDGVESVPTLLGSDGDFPFSLSNVSLTEGAHTILAIARVSGGSTISDSVNVTYDAVAPVPPVPQPTTIAIDCPGANGEGVDNNLTGTTVATIAPGALGAGSGPIIVTTDLDFFSNFFTGSAIGQNRTFALNSFAWLMDNIVPAKIPDTYFPLTNPIRVYDSRLSGGAIASGAIRSVKVAGVTVGSISVPAEATSVIANVTAVDPEQAGFLTVYPSGSAPPTNTSTHNFGQGENFANTVVMAVGAGGNISILNQAYSGTGSTQVLVDIIGYSRALGTGAHLRTIAPVRALDSRVGTGGPKDPFHARAPRDLTIVGLAGIPSNVQAVVLNMTVANATTTGSFVTVWPSGEAQPGISNINIIAGITRPNLVVARVNNGKVSIVNDSGDTDILADVVGYFEPGGTGGSITGKTPTRELDTRAGTAFGQGETRQMTIQGLPGIPAGAKTVILKVTAADPTANGGYLTVWPTSAGSTPPNVSNLNFNAGMNIPNLVITQIGTDGKINIFNAFGSTHVLVDVLGYAD